MTTPSHIVIPLDHIDVRKVESLGALRIDLTEIIRKARAEALADIVAEAEAVIADGDAAEVCAPVPGEVGRSAVVAKRDALYDDPVSWINDYRAALAGGKGDA